jgi:hypothetical protein
MGWVVNATLWPLYPLERPGTHYIEGWVSPRAGKDGCGKTHPPPEFDPQPSSPWRVAIPTALSWTLSIFFILSPIQKPQDWKVLYDTASYAVLLAVYSKNDTYLLLEVNETT